MYNFKEKKLHFNALRNPDAAAFDLELLQKSSPSHPKLRTFSRDPKRYCDDILYALLDLISREDIRGFRRAKQEEALQHVPDDSDDIPVGEGDNLSPADEKVDNPPVVTTEEKIEGADTSHENTVTNAPPAAEAVKDNTQSVEKAASEAVSTEQTEELKQSLEETEERADEAQQRAEEAEEAQEEAEQRAEEAEERAEAAESALEEEKKKEQTVAAPAKSKSIKSTRKSTGTTSSTRKSK